MACPMSGAGFDAAYANQRQSEIRVQRESEMQMNNNGIQQCPVQHSPTSPFGDHNEKVSLETQQSSNHSQTYIKQEAQNAWVSGVTPEEFFNPKWQPKTMQKIVAEGILLAGGGVAILLQVANPGVGAGVNNHSNFAYRPIDRLRTTMSYVYTMAFGTPAEKRTIIGMVHRAHAPVEGVSDLGGGDGTPGGVVYNANDPELQLWVAATLYAAGVDIYEKIYGKFDQATSEQIYREYSVLAMSLRVPPEMWPATRVDFWKYWDESVSKFVVTEDAKSVCRDLMWNKEGPLWMRANLPLIRLLTAEWLPPAMRDAYGLKTSKTRRATYNVLMATGKIVYPMVPKPIRQFPMRYYLNDMRKRMAAVEANMV